MKAQQKIYCAYLCIIDSPSVTKHFLLYDIKIISLHVQLILYEISLLSFSVNFDAYP